SVRTRRICNPPLVADWSARCSTASPMRGRLPSSPQARCGSAKRRHLDAVPRRRLSSNKLPRHPQKPPFWPSLEGIAMRALKLIGSLVFAGALASTGAGAQTLRAISFIPKNDPVLAMANAWVSEVNAKLGGHPRINYVGGPEVITRFQQVEALRTGVVDVVFTPSGDYQD